MLIGSDLSEFQGQIDWPVYKNNSNFAFIKAGEGTSYIDKWFGNNRSQARNFGLPHGFYHFARPDLGNSPQDEAKFFCSLIDGDPVMEGEFLALDFEVSYNDPVNWCKAWLDTVSDHFNGVKPLIYLNQALVKDCDWTPVINAGYGLWLASYNPDGTGNTGQWPLMAFQQTSSTQQVPGISGNVDRDIFFGDLAQLKAYGYNPNPQPIPMPQQSSITISTGTTIQTNPQPTSQPQPMPEPPQSPTTSSLPQSDTLSIPPPTAPTKVKLNWLENLIHLFFSWILK